MTKRGYICAIAWDHEVENTDVTIYESVAKCLADHGDCGVVEVAMTEVKTIRRGGRFKVNLDMVGMRKRQLHEAKKQLRQWGEYVAKLERKS